MKTLQVVVLERDICSRAQLVLRLSNLGVDGVGDTGDAREAIRLCVDKLADLLMCSLPVEPADYMDLLRQVAALNPKPAVAFHGAVTDIDQIETLCLNLGLRYLGLLTPPIGHARLQRMIRQLTTIRAKGHSA